MLYLGVGPEMSRRDLFESEKVVVHLGTATWSVAPISGLGEVHIHMYILNIIEHYHKYLPYIE